MNFYCRKNVENERYSEFYAESHFVLPFWHFPEKKLAEKSYVTFYFFDIALASGTTVPFLSK